MEVRGWKGGVPRHKCFRSSQAGSTLITDGGLILDVCAQHARYRSLRVKQTSSC